MAKENPPSSEQPQSVNLGVHPLVSKLHPDLDHSADLVSLVGYLGPSKDADNIRLYRDLSFNHYFEIPTASITATTPVDANDPNSPTVIHVPASAKLEAVSHSSQSVEAGLLKGAITNGYLTSATTGVSEQATLQTQRTIGCTAGCNPPSRHCQTLATCNWLCTLVNLCGAQAQEGVHTVQTVGCVGPTGYQGCQNTVTTTVQPTHLLGCTTVTSSPTTQVQANAATATTLATVCTQFCHTHPNACGTTLATVCTQTCNVPGVQAQVGPTGYQGCQNTVTTTVQPTHLMGCTTVTSNPTYGCHVQPQANVAGTAATVCTQYGCIHETTWTQFCHTAHNVCVTNTVATVCTQICAAQVAGNAVTTTVQPTHLMGCTTVTSNPTYGCAPQAQAVTVITVGSYGCTTGCPTIANCPTAGCVGPTGWHTCQPAGANQAQAVTVITVGSYGCTTGCPTIANCPTAGCVGPTGWHTCLPTVNCPQAAPTVINTIIPPTLQCLPATTQCLPPSLQCPPPTPPVGQA
jgi:hypothetical protein